jgi:signal transduction histidine kinase
MFRNFRTSTKLLLLCGVFMASVGVATYELVTEKQLAIEFARKELAGVRFLGTVREAYAAMLAGETSAPFERAEAVRHVAETLEAAEVESAGAMGTAELTAALTASLRDLSRALRHDTAASTGLPEALTNGQKLVARVGDGSNLTLDPDLDSYYLQNTLVMKLPALLGELGSLRALAQHDGGRALDENERAARLRFARSRLRALRTEIESNMAAAFRESSANPARVPIKAALGKAVAAGDAYLSAFDAPQGAAPIGHAFADAVTSSLAAWDLTQAELDRLLRQRIDDLGGGMRRSLFLVGALAGLSLVIAVLTHRHIVRPLQQLEGLALKVRATKDYSLRSGYTSRDEIGELATAFNDMLSELASAREREALDQAELARVARLTTMGTMAGSIAHEINQPLAAIVTNSNAAVRWLNATPPDLGEVRAALARIAGDGRRASEVIGGIRALFKNDIGAAAPLAVNDLVLEVLDVLQGELRNQGVSLRTELAGDLPLIAGHRVQLQQVVVNLVVNAIEAMKAVPSGSRQLLVRSETAEAERVLVAVEDSGPGIDPKSIDRIFNAFYTTKEQGTGMGLAICRTIVEAHGGRLWASARHPAGSIFHFALPSLAAEEA